MTDAQRAFWIDLLAMAGRSRFPGIICAGKTLDGKFVGYPISKFQSLMSEPINVEETFALFERTGKISVEITSESPVKLLKVELLNWGQYQSEYQRQKKYPGRGLQQSDPESDNHSNKTEREAETEGEGEERRRKGTAAYLAIGFEQPFGQPRFQKIWEEEFAKEAEWLTIKMEATIQRCQKLRVGIPPQFYDAKHAVEARENADAKTRLRRTPL
jgi:hypothetical protein